MKQYPSKVAALFAGALLLGAVISWGCSAHTPRILDDDSGRDADVDAIHEDEPLCLAEEICEDDLDNDCDGLVDEYCDSSECPPGVEVPTEESCQDGIDNDCDGEIDEDCPPDPDDCLCHPSAMRYCDTPTYSTIGQQRCTEDGLMWGPCDEILLEHECMQVDGWYSPNQERCLLAYGVCVQDMWDLDHDGDTWESLGSCVDILCHDPTHEVCGNLFDDDEDGHVDEVCGECECSWGTWRWCDTPTHGRLGIQYCDENGEWGRCDETAILDVCESVASWYSPELEHCLIESGECAQDMWDLDDDGDHWESLGECPDQLCFE